MNQRDMDEALIHARMALMATGEDIVMEAAREYYKAVAAHLAELRKNRNRNGGTH